MLSFFMKNIPFEMTIRGRRRKFGLSICDRIFPLDRSRLYKLDHYGLIIDPKIDNERLLFFFFHNILRHYYKSPLAIYMKSRLNKGDLFLDIGANLGVYSYIAKECGALSYVFEPEPNHVAFHKRNDVLYDKLFNCAVSDKNGTAEFFVAGNADSGASSLVMSDKGWEASIYESKVTVQTERLDKLLNEQEMAKAKLVKIDVEGNEYKTISGMTKMLETNKNMDIWCEVRGESSDRGGGSYRKVIDYLSGHGFQPFIFDGKIRKFEDLDIKRVFDLLFISDRSRP